MRIGEKTFDRDSFWGIPKIAYGGGSVDETHVHQRVVRVLGVPPRCYTATRPHSSNKTSIFNTVSLRTSRTNTVYLSKQAQITE